MGLRIAQANNVELEDVKVYDLENLSMPGLKDCGDYSKTCSFSNVQPGFVGNDLRGNLKKKSYKNPFYLLQL
jgi:hypothetical protein